MKRYISTGAVLILLISLAGCGPQTTPAPSTPSESPPEAPSAAVAPGDLIIAEAVIEPADWNHLNAPLSGTVEEVLVEPGEVVEAGQRLVQLDDRDAELAVAQAEAALAANEVRLAMLQAGPRAEEIARAEAQLEAARAALAQAVALRDEVNAGGVDAQLAAAQAELAGAQTEQLIARQQHDETMRCYDVPQPDGSVREECPALGTYEERARFALQAADRAVEAAQARLEAIQGSGEAQSAGASAGIWSASAQRDVAQAQLDLINAGPTAEEIAAAEAAIQQAEVNLAMAESALERYAITAPFAGTVTSVRVKMGERLFPDQRVCTLASLSELEARTIDLTELAVGRLNEGLPAEVIVDALPELTLQGTVTEIGLEAESYQGDVTYPVVVQLDGELPEQLRWGMTAIVRIETPRE